MHNIMKIERSCISSHLKLFTVFIRKGILLALRTFWIWHCYGKSNRKHLYIYEGYKIVNICGYWKTSGVSLFFNWHWKVFTIYFKYQSGTFGPPCTLKTKSLPKFLLMSFVSIQFKVIKKLNVDIIGVPS